MKYRDLPDVFKTTKFTNDMTDLMTEILAKISKINSGPAVTVLNQILVNTTFLELIKRRLLDEEYENKII